MKRFIIITGETSGDIYGSGLMRMMQKTHSEKSVFWGIGGEKMEMEGLCPLEDINNISVVGFTEIFKKIPSINSLLNRISEFANDIKPDGLILIDFPGFNIRLSKKLKKKFKVQFPIIYFVSPQLWAWNEGRIKSIKKYIDKMIVIFPFEEPFYKKHDIDAIYLGHPFLDDWTPSNNQELKKEFGFNENKKLVSIFPGSRSLEVKTHLPIYIESIKDIQAKNNNCEFALGLAPSFSSSAIQQNYSTKNIKIIDQDPLKLLECSDVAIVTSGTISLQASLMGTPCVVGYKLSFLSWVLSKILIKVKYISMTNIIADRMIIPELIQYKMTPQNIGDQINKLLNESKYYDAVQESLLEVKNIFLNKQNVMKNAAKIIHTMCNEKN